MMRHYVCTLKNSFTANKKSVRLKCKWKLSECTICGRFNLLVGILWSPTSASAMNYVALMALIIVEIETLSDFLRKHNSIEIQCQATRLSPTIPEIIVKKWIICGNCLEVIKRILNVLMKRSFRVTCRWWSTTLESDTMRDRKLKILITFFIPMKSQNAGRCYLKIRRRQEETWRWLINSNLTLISD